MASKASSSNVRLGRNFSAVFKELEALENALSYAQDGVGLDPSHITCLHVAGLAHMHLGQYEQAIVKLQEAAKLVRLICSKPHK